MNRQIQWEGKGKLCLILYNTASFITGQNNLLIYQRNGVWLVCTQGYALFRKFVNIIKPKIWLANLLRNWFFGRPDTFFSVELNWKWTYFMVNKKRFRYSLCFWAHLTRKVINFTGLSYTIPRYTYIWGPLWVNCYKICIVTVNENIKVASKRANGKMLLVRKRFSKYHPGMFSIFFFFDRLVLIILQLYKLINVL